MPTDRSHAAFHATRSAFLAVACVASCCLSLGCSDGRPTRVPVSGRVEIDGEPLTTGTVLFVPKGTRPSGGNLDSEGRFTLTCFDGEDGVVLGTHRVQVSASDLTSGRAVWLAPRKYSDFRTSGLTQEVSEPTDDVLIELTWEGEERPKK